LDIVKKARSEKILKTEIKDPDLVRLRRLQIVKGASKLFRKKGYFRTGMREISKASGLTIGNLYDYITEKEDVLYLVFDVFHSNWGQQLEKEGVLEIEDPLQQIRIAIRKMLELINNQRDMVLLMYRESNVLQKTFLQAILEKESKVVELFEAILRRGIEIGVFKNHDPFFLANLIVYMLSMEPLRGWNLRKRLTVEEINNLIEEHIVGVLVNP
jgi:AcrR family transcriptional regulator